SANAPRLEIIPSTGDGGEITVCKAPADGPSQSFTFTWTRTVLVVGPNDAGKGNVGDETNGEFQLQPGGCTDLPTSIFGGAGLERLVIVESAPPSGWDLTDIDIVQGIPGGYTPPAPGTTDAFDVPTRTATIYINDDMERRVTFTNTFTEEPPPPPPVVCTRTI